MMSSSRGNCSLNTSHQNIPVSPSPYTPSSSQSSISPGMFLSQGKNYDGFQVCPFYYIVHFFRKTSFNFLINSYSILIISKGIDFYLSVCQIWLYTYLIYSPTKFYGLKDLIFFLVFVSQSNIFFITIPHLKYHSDLALISFRNFINLTISGKTINSAVIKYAF